MDWLLVLIAALCFHAVVMLRAIHQDREIYQVVRRVDAVLTQWALEWGQGTTEATRLRLLETLRKHGADV